MMTSLGWEDVRTRCRVPSNDCLDNACQNGATCIDGARRYTCVCPPGYAGKHCNIRRRHHRLRFAWPVGSSLDLTKKLLPKCTGVSVTCDSIYDFSLQCAFTCLFW